MGQREGIGRLENKSYGVLEGGGKRERETSISPSFAYQQKGKGEIKKYCATTFKKDRFVLTVNERGLTSRKRNCEVEDWFFRPGGASSRLGRGKKKGPPYLLQAIGGNPAKKKNGFSRAEKKRGNMPRRPQPTHLLEGDIPL